MICVVLLLHRSRRNAAPAAAPHLREIIPLDDCELGW
jgi:hypothetical protein